ncbi:Uncharacterised protein [Serratia fonticola]|uniref:Uncharacterized protein n=1 Tax=Serratia fonticola TaxID=47917 RepID=A0A4U9V164_SERFO|nr:Uncharacterised protein [Serratia fonticola]
MRDQGQIRAIQANLAAAEEKLSKANADLNAAKVATKEAGAITEQKKQVAMETARSCRPSARTNESLCRYAWLRQYAFWHCSTDREAPQ